MTIIRKIINIIFILFVFSCAKENDPLKSGRFEDPLLINGSTDVALRYTWVGFTKFQGMHIKYYAGSIKGIYLDTINPPVQFFDSKLLNAKNLLPDKTYYWAHVIENISGEIWSDIQSFSTVSMNGFWKLDTIIVYDPNPYGKMDSVFLDSVLIKKEDFTEIYITDVTAQLKLFGSEDENYINTIFSYDENMYSMDFYDTSNDTTYSINIINAGYLANYQRVALYFKSKKGHYLLYTRD